VTAPATDAESVVAYIGLGSNRGDRFANLRCACDHLASTPGTAIEAYSNIYETESVEGGGEGDFLNAAIRIRTSYTAEELLAQLLEIERQLGRPVPPRLPGPRVIDLDLLLYANEQISLPDLIVPHPRMIYRPFVLRPLCDVLEGSGRVELTTLSLQ